MTTTTTGHAKPLDFRVAVRVLPSFISETEFAEIRFVYFTENSK
jgi:hypothetical protein